jgi:hypothetical protein
VNNKLFTVSITHDYVAFAEDAAQACSRADDALSVTGLSGATHAHVMPVNGGIPKLPPGWRLNSQVFNPEGQDLTVQQALDAMGVTARQMPLPGVE